MWIAWVDYSNDNKEPYCDAKMQGKMHIYDVGIYPHEIQVPCNYTNESFLQVRAWIWQRTRNAPKYWYGEEKHFRQATDYEHSFEPWTHVMVYWRRRFWVRFLAEAFLLVTHLKFDTTRRRKEERKILSQRRSWQLHQLEQGYNNRT